MSDLFDYHAAWTKSRWQTRLRALYLIPCSLLAGLVMLPIICLMEVIGYLFLLSPYEAVDSVTDFWHEVVRETPDVLVGYWNIVWHGDLWHYRGKQREEPAGAEVPNGEP